MTDQKSTQNSDPRKKLQKREQRILERLQEARDAQVKALERFHRAEARSQKRMARVQRFEGRLAFIRQQLVELNTPSLVGAQFIAPQFIVPSSSDKTENVKEAPDWVKEARAAAGAAEENARQAVARVAKATSRAEQTGLGRHLEQELRQVEAEADQANAIAQETSDDFPQSSLEEVAEIAMEEEIVEAITAKTIAEVAAERAAEAEAFAEASSVYSQEARQRAQQAEQALEEVHVAISNSLLTGEEAKNALQNAESEVTRAQASLADAEAAEEQALSVAMNAEAEAEVAEGMAFAAANHTTPLPEEEEQVAQERAGAEQQAIQNSFSLETVNNEEADVTLKISRVHPQENQ